MTFFDVGQGLSVLVEVEGSLILYDTGPAFGDGYSAARQVVLPAIRRKGYDFIDLLVISHGDNDHAGGLADIGETLPIGRLVEGDACTGAWRWGRAAFRLLSAWQLKGNDNSCLLEISLGETRLLLTGDIGTRAEYQLLDDLLPYVTVMSAPHHGSDTSSSPALLNHTWPQLVVASTGYRNRFQHPSELVKQRYLNRHILFLDTAEEGAIRVGFQQDGSYRVKRARDSQPALWRRRRAADDAL